MGPFKLTRHDGGMAVMADDPQGWWEATTSGLDFDRMLTPPIRWPTTVNDADGINGCARDEKGFLEA